MENVLSIGIIGVGGIARSHIRAIEQCEAARLVAVMDINEARAREVAESQGVRAYGDLDAILGDEEVEAVVICTPHNLHAAQTIAAAQAGKHVLVEKPMALSVADCDRMIQACEAAGRILMVGQVMRHYPVNQKIRALLAEGAIGEVGHLMRRRYSYFNPAAPEGASRHWYLDPEVGGNCVLYGFGSHEYDILHWYLDSPVVKVYAQGTSSTELYRGQKDSYTALMNHANGAVSVLSQSVVCHSPAHDQYIVGSEGTIMMAGDRLLLNNRAVPVEGSSGEGMRRQMEAFVSCCLEGRPPDASGRSVRHTMAVIEAAKLSAERNEAVWLSELDS